jgi:hypothetical protein
MAAPVLPKVLVAVAAAAVCGVSATAVHAQQRDDGLARVRHATAKYHDLAVAQSAGYAKLVDVEGIACIDMPGMGAMGVHYVKGDLVTDSKADPLRPEALVYEPGPGDTVRLVAVEYVIFQAGWDAEHRSRPRLFGEEFALTTAPNRFGLDAFYSLHAWVWKANPAGTFAMWNPRVHCPGSGGHTGQHVHAGHGT